MTPHGNHINRNDADKNGPTYRITLRLLPIQDEFKSQKNTDKLSFLFLKF